MSWELLIPVGAGVLRNVAGWLENSLKDGKIQGYEVTQLVSTTNQVFVLSVSTMYGLGLDAASASGVGILASFLLKGLKG